MNRWERRSARKQTPGGGTRAMGEAVLQLFQEAVRQHGAGRYDAAAAAYQRALMIEPDHAVIHENLGTELAHLGRLEAAAACYRQALALAPNVAQVHGNLGIILRQLGRRDEAVASYRRAIALAPSFAEAHNNLGNILKEMQDLNGAIAAFRRAVALKPGLSEALSNLTYARKSACDWRGLDKDEAQCRALVRSGTGEIAPFVFLSLSASPEEHLACARSWAKAKMRQISALPPRAVTPREKLRLGYISGDFRHHAMGTLAAELFELHDRSRFEVIAYAYNGDDGSALRRRMEQGFDRFVDIRALSHADAAKLIRADGIDILVDLTGHTEGARLPILAWRPAPIQVNFLGYPGTLGTTCMDYVIADPITVPMTDQPYFDEKIVHLPQCYQPNDRQREVAARTPSREECSLPDAGFVFACFNNPYKITPVFFDVWMRLLRAVPESVLWLLKTNAAAEANLHREAVSRGVDAARVVFAPLAAPPEHLARQRCADLFLDTLPYNAHTTASDALWVGLPVLTCKGTSFAGRVAASLLGAVGLPELVTQSLGDYETLALKLATDTAFHAAIARKLAANRPTAPLFDTDAFARDIEAAYRRMWEIWAAGKPPEAFAVAPPPA